MRRVADPGAARSGQRCRKSAPDTPVPAASQDLEQRDTTVQGAGGAVERVVQPPGHHPFEVPETATVVIGQRRLHGIHAREQALQRRAKLLGAPCRHDRCQERHLRRVGRAQLCGVEGACRRGRHQRRQAAASSAATPALSRIRLMCSSMLSSSVRRRHVRTTSRCRTVIPIRCLTRTCQH